MFVDGSKPGRRWLGVVIAACLALSACSGDSSSELSSSESDGDESVTTAESTTTTTATTTSTESTTTTLSAEQEAYDEQIELAGRLMEPITGFHLARNACLADPPNCDFEAIDSFTTEEFVGTTAQINELVDERWYYVDPDPDIFFVRHRLDSESPLVAAVWTCMTIGADAYRLDATGTTIEEAAGNRRAEIVVFQVTEQVSDELRVQQVLALDDEGDEQPEGGTCDAYEEWPPPPPSS